MTGNLRRGFSIMELLVVVSIIGVLSLALVPTAEISFIRLKEVEFEENLKAIRLAISRWRTDAEASVERELRNRGEPRSLMISIPEERFYPPDIASLTKAGAYVIDVKPGLSATFNHIPYMTAIPADPFCGGPVWTQWLASSSTGVASNEIKFGRITEVPGPETGTGVFDVSGHPATDTRRGFMQAIDGTFYYDW